MKKLSSTIIAFGFLLLAGISHAASINISVDNVPPGSNSYLVNKNDLAALSALDVFIEYDTATLANPRPTAGPLVAGASFVANPNIRGKIYIGLATLTPISRSGTLATIIFDRKSNNRGILKVTAEAYDAQTKPLTLDSLISDSSAGETKTAGDSTEQSATGTDNKGTIPTSSTTPSGNRGLSVTMPSGNVDPKADEKVQKSLEQQEAPSEATHKEPSKGPEEPGTVAKPESQEEKITWNPPVITSVLNRFRDFRGSRSPKDLLALFNDDKKSPVQQEPAVVLSDGVSKTTISVELPSGNQAPNFAFDKATAVSIKQNGTTWILTVLPNKNVSAATVVILFADRSMEFPITVAPPVADLQARKGTLNEASFNQFLNARGTEKAPLGDLNKDGYRDYVDDYIYACNYLSLTPPASGKALAK